MILKYLDYTLMLISLVNKRLSGIIIIINREFMDTLHSVSPRTVSAGGDGETPDDIALKLAISLENQVTSPIQFK